MPPNPRTTIQGMLSDDGKSSFPSKKEVINSYAFKNPSLFGDGMGVINKSGSNTNIDRSNMKNMLGRLDGLKPGCSSCGGKK